MSLATTAMAFHYDRTCPCCACYGYTLVGKRPCCLLLFPYPCDCHWVHMVLIFHPCVVQTALGITTLLASPFSEFIELRAPRCSDDRAPQFSGGCALSLLIELPAPSHSERIWSFYVGCFCFSGLLGLSAEKRNSQPARERCTCCCE